MLVQGQAQVTVKALVLAQVQVQVPKMMYWMLAWQLRHTHLRKKHLPGSRPAKAPSRNSFGRCGLGFSSIRALHVLAKRRLLRGGALHAYRACVLPVPECTYE